MTLEQLTTIKEAIGKIEDFRAGTLEKLRHSNPTMKGLRTIENLLPSSESIQDECLQDQFKDLKICIENITVNLKKMDEKLDNLYELSEKAEREAF